MLTNATKKWQDYFENRVLARSGQELQSSREVINKCVYRLLRKDRDCVDERSGGWDGEREGEGEGEGGKREEDGRGRMLEGARRRSEGKGKRKRTRRRMRRKKKKRKHGEGKGVFVWKVGCVGQEKGVYQVLFV